MSGNLYVVATPIGNSKDITERAKTVLQEVDIIAAEDTRTTQILMSMLKIRNKMVSNHKFNEKQQLDYLLAELNQGKSIAVVSDAGTPCISDPGSIIVSGAAAMGIPVIGVSGASAVITALSVSGFIFDGFTFYGFLPKKDKEIKAKLQKANNSQVPVSIFFESPRRIINTVEIAAAILPGADLCLCNDLTKMHERIYRGDPNDVLAQLRANPNTEKGEYVLVIQAPRAEQELETKTDSPAEITKEALLADYLVNHQCTVKEALSALADKYKGNISKKELYAASLNLKKIFGKNNPDVDPDENPDENSHQDSHDLMNDLII